MYLIQNKILCKHYEDHVKAVSQKVKKASLAPFQQQGLLVKHVYGRDDKNRLPVLSPSREALPQGMFAP